MTIILTKDSGTRENVLYICMGDYDLSRFNKKMSFPTDSEVKRENSEVTKTRTREDSDGKTHVIDMITPKRKITKGKQSSQ